MSRLLVTMDPIKIETVSHTITTHTAQWFDFDQLIKSSVTIAEYENGTTRRYTEKTYFNSREDLTIEYFRVKEINENL